MAPYIFRATRESGFINSDFNDEQQARTSSLNVSGKTPTIFIIAWSPNSLVCSCPASLMIIGDNSLAILLLFLLRITVDASLYASWCHHSCSCQLIRDVIFPVRDVIIPVLVFCLTLIALVRSEERRNCCCWLVNFVITLKNARMRGRLVSFLIVVCMTFLMRVPFKGETQL